VSQTYKKKLIEVAIPLEAINTASAREKSIRHGHPSTLHLWWARRPLAACRAVLFAQLVDDPSGYADKLLDDPKIRERAEPDLAFRRKAWRERKADAQGNVPDTPEPTLEDCAADIERKRLFGIIEELVKWENSTNEEVLERARAEIRRSCGGVLPPIYDPFSGGGSIPLEAQRLGLPAYGSDLNPVAVMIGKAMIEIPPMFKDREPIHPGAKERQFYRNAEGLAEDVKYYGEWMREKAWERIGHLYPQVDLPKHLGGGKATVVAWIWARTVPSPDPAFASVPVPIASSFLLTPMKGKEAWIEPIVDKSTKTITYRIRHGGTADELSKAKDGTKSGRGANFVCVLSGTAITPEYVKETGRAGRMGQALIAIVAEGKGGRYFIEASAEHEAIAFSTKPSWKPETALPADPRNFWTIDYGLTTFGSLFTNRQLVALNTFSDLVEEARQKAEEDAIASGLSAEGGELRNGGTAAKAYAEAVSVYLSFLISKLADKGSTICTWDAGPASNKSASGRSARVATVRVTFGRQSLPMTWDFAEVNFFSSSVGALETVLKTLATPIQYFPPQASSGSIVQHDAQTVDLPEGAVISSDPPYYDNIGYSDLSDFFFCWLRPSLKKIFPDIFGLLATPKTEELVATPYRHEGKDSAEAFFLAGMRSAIHNMVLKSSDKFPATIYYAFKQSEVSQEGISSTGWATFLQAVIEAGYAVVGTWPVRTEMASRMIASGTNALANSVVLVCRKKEITAEVVTRAEFIRALKRELPPAISELQAANIAPADMPQSAIGPGMGVFSRYKAVLESDDSPMSVKAALQLINRELDEYLGGIQGEFDADTRFSITWFEQHGMARGEYGVADNLARARGISVESVKHAGIIESAAGKVRILARDELDDDWEPEGDGHLTVWECLQHLVRKYEKDGISHDTAVLLKKIDAKAEAVKDLAYCLYDISANKRKDAKEATAYNALIADWTELTRQAAAIHDTSGDRQIRLDI
jgi:putative DNA methylase